MSATQSNASNPAHGTFTGHSVFGEVPFTAAEDAAIDAALAARATNNSTWATITTAAQFHAVPLKRGRKTPSNSGWTSAPALNEKSIGAHLDGGGNVGALLGASGERGLIAWDLDNELATEAVTAAGYRTITIPANSYNPNHSKGRFGGRHAVWAVPAEWGVDGMSLTAPNATVTLANGGTADVLTGAKFIVLPPSVLCEEGHLAYYNPAGAAWPGPVEPLPVEYWPDRWRPADTPEPPAGLEAFRVDIRPKTVFDAAEERYLSGGSIELTEKVDAVPMGTWLAMDTDGLIEVLDQVSSCGCHKGRFKYQSSPTGLELHDGCAFGHSVHVHSGSCAAVLASNNEHRDHMSWPDFIAGMYGRSFRDVAREAGIELHQQREELGGITAAEFEADADRQEALGNLDRARDLRLTAARRRADVQAYMEQQGEVFLAGPVLGVPTALSPTPASANAPETERPQLTVIPGGLDPAPRIGTIGSSVGPSPAPSIGTIPKPTTTWTPEPINGEPEAEPVHSGSIGPRPSAPVPTVTDTPAPETVSGEPAPSADEQIQAIKQRARTQLLYASEKALYDRIFCTELMAGLRERSRVAMVSPTMKLMADLSAVLSLIPPTLTIPAIVTDKRSGFNSIHSVVARSGSGKGGADDASFVPVWKPTPGFVMPGMPPRIPASRAVGSGEVIASRFASVEEDESGAKVAKVHTENGRLYWPEITKIAAVKGKNNSTLAAELCQLWSSEGLGSDTKNDAAFCDPHTYRATVTIGSQLATIALLYDPAASLMGLSQRIWLVSGEDTESPERDTPEWWALMKARPDSTKWTLEIPRFPVGDVEVDDEVAVEVRIMAYDLRHGEETQEVELRTHTALMRLRYALAAAVYHGEEPRITKQWWDWTAELAEHHHRVRRAAMIAAGIGSVGEATQQGVKEALKKQAREATEHTLAMQGSLKWARKRDAPFTSSQMGHPGGANSYRRANHSDIAADLVTAGLIEQVLEQLPTDPGPVLRYRVTELGRTQDVDGV